MRRSSFESHMQASAVVSSEDEAEGDFHAIEEDLRVSADALAVNELSLSSSSRGDDVNALKKKKRSDKEEAQKKGGEGSKAGSVLGFFKRAPSPTLGKSGGGDRGRGAAAPSRPAAAAPSVSPSTGKGGSSGGAGGGAGGSASSSTGDVVLRIAALQDATGWWEPGPVVALLTGLKGDPVKATPTIAGVAATPAARLWITAVVLAWLARAHGADEDAWRLFAQKARTWVKKQLAASKVQVDLLEQARQWASQ